MNNQENKTPEKKHIVETLLFITNKPIALTKLVECAELIDKDEARQIIAELKTQYEHSAIQINEVAGGYQLSTKPEFGRWVRKLFAEKMVMKLSPAALESLAIIAYKQPITKAEVESIRGVDSGAPLERLLEKELVKIAGRKDNVGKPLIYATTEEFLRLFGINRVNDLPDIASFASKEQENGQDLPFIKEPDEDTETIEEPDVPKEDEVVEQVEPQPEPELQPEPQPQLQEEVQQQEVERE